MTAAPSAVEDDEEAATAWSPPVLHPVLVVADTELEPLARSARASVAMLALQLRAALRDADAGQRDEPSDPTGEDTNDPRMLELLRSSLEERVERRRHDLAQELGDVRAEAAASIAAARTEVASLVAAAREEMLQALAGAGEPPVAAAPPNLRIVTGGGVDGHAVTVHSLTRSPAVTPNEGMPASQDAVARPRDPAVPEPERQPAAESKPQPRAEAQPQPEPQPRPELRPQPVAAVFAEPSVPVTDYLAPAVVTLSPPPGSAASVKPAGGRPLWARYLYLDVVLPLVAVIVVLIVLLAWLG